MTEPAPPPEAAVAQNRQGIQLAQQGQLDASAAAFREALRLAPDYFDAHLNLGNVLTFLGRLDEARASYERALALRPREAVLLNNLSNLLRTAGDLAGAAARAREALQLQPNYAEAHNNLGTALLQQQDYAAAAAEFRAALALKPNLIEAASNLGEALRGLRQFDDAIAWCRHALAQAPNFAEAHNHLGSALADTGALDEAVTELREALRLRPDLVEPRANLAFALFRLGRLDEAEAYCQEAVRMRPTYAHALNLLGVVRSRRHRFDEAMALYDRALKLQPDFADAHFHRGLLLMLRGDLRAGLPEYEWRTRSVIAWGRLPGPEWDGRPFPGKTLLIHPEQGVGDLIQFLRFAPEVKKRGGTVLLAAPAPLRPLLRGCRGIDDVVPAEALPAADLHVRLLSLPYRLGTTIDTIPADVPYLFPPEHNTDHWRSVLAGLKGRKVGLVWQGSPQHLEDRTRSIPLALFAPLTRVPGVSLVSLQKGPGAEQLSASGLPITDLGPTLDAAGAFLDTATVMRQLDLLISCDTSLVHLAGAMARPVWMATPYAPDWRWFLDREDSPWYPTLRLFRAPGPADWGPVIARMADELRRG